MAHDPLSFFEKSHSFGSLFIFANKEGENRVVCEIKVINDGQGEIAFIPLGDEDELNYQEGDLLDGINESSNVSFEIEVLKNHGHKWITCKIPSEIKLVNLRQEPRIQVTEEIKASEMILISYGEEGKTRLTDMAGDVLDISATGASFEVNARRLDCFYKGETVELKVSEKFPYLARIKGTVVHKTLCKMNSKDDRSYRIGIRFQKKIDLTPLANLD